MTPAAIRRQRLVARVCRLGARAVAELLDEIARAHELGGDIDGRLERFAAIDPNALVALGGDRFPPRPTLRAVPSEMGGR